VRLPGGAARSSPVPEAAAADARALGRMALFRRLFYQRPPEGLVEISGNILGACPFSPRYSVIMLF
jgi:hypothetical protein